MTRYRDAGPVFTRSWGELPGQRQIIRIIAQLLLMGWALLGLARPLSAQQMTPPDDRQAYLPLVFDAKADETSNPDFARNLPIWPHDGAPAPHEVALFRHHFALATALSDARLHIFADTRYEVWVDGHWLGRGPARFSQARHEYDTHLLGDLGPGEHLAAVLVQWAPNTRRSESITPHLLAHIAGQTANGVQVVARTNGSWRAQLSPAWRQDAAPVHTWQLIGPTELVDLRQLPGDWMTPALVDADWPYAVTRPVAQNIHYPTRSIPLLVEALMPIALIDAGILSPGRGLGQLAPSEPMPGAWTFTLHHPATITIETLTEFQNRPTQQYMRGVFSKQLHLDLFNPPPRQRILDRVAKQPTAQLESRRRFPARCTGLHDSLTGRDAQPLFPRGTAKPGSGL